MLRFLPDHILRKVILIEDQNGEINCKFPGVLPEKMKSIHANPVQEVLGGKGVPPEKEF